jgi:hypothetical protein
MWGTLRAIISIQSRGPGWNSIILCKVRDQSILPNLLRYGAVLASEDPQNLPSEHVAVDRRQAPSISQNVVQDPIDPPLLTEDVHGGSEIRHSMEKKAIISSGSKRTPHNLFLDPFQIYKMSALKLSPGSNPVISTDHKSRLSQPRTTGDSDLCPKQDRNPYLQPL